MHGLVSAVFLFGGWRSEISMSDLQVLAISIEAERGYFVNWSGPDPSIAAPWRIENVYFFRTWIF